MVYPNACLCQPLTFHTIGCRIRIMFVAVTNVVIVARLTLCMVLFGCVVAAINYRKKDHAGPPS